MLLSIKDLTCRLRDSERQFSLEVPLMDLTDSKPIALVGPSGCGKSTLLRIIALLQECQAKQFDMSVKGNSTDIKALWYLKNSQKISQIRAQELGYIAASGGLYPSLSILSNALLRAEIAGRSDTANKQIIMRLAEALEIPGSVLDAPLQKLSRGQQSRGAILQALVHSPKLIVSDEPTSALHPTLAKNVMELLINEAKKNGGGLVVATHDVKLAETQGFSILQGYSTTEDKLLKTVFR